jgi:hypothetical protein
MALGKVFDLGIAAALTYPRLQMNKHDTHFNNMTGKNIRIGTGIS